MRSISIAIVVASILWNSIVLAELHVNIIAIDGNMYSFSEQRSQHDGYAMERNMCESLVKYYGNGATLVISTNCEMVLYGLETSNLAIDVKKIFGCDVGNYTANINVASCPKSVFPLMDVLGTSRNHLWQVSQRINEMIFGRGIATGLFFYYK